MVDVIQGGHYLALEGCPVSATHAAGWMSLGNIGSVDGTGDKRPQVTYAVYISHPELCLTKEIGNTVSYCLGLGNMGKWEVGISLRR